MASFQEFQQEFEQELATRQNNLLQEIQNSSKSKISNLNAICQMYEFTKFTTEKSQKYLQDAHNSDYRNFSPEQIKEYINNSRPREAAQNLYQEFASIINANLCNNNEEEEEVFLIDNDEETSSIKNNEPDLNRELRNAFGLNQEGKIYFAYIYHLLFINMMTVLEDFLSQLLVLVLKAYPMKLEKTKVTEWDNKTVLFSEIETQESYNVISHFLRNKEPKNQNITNQNIIDYIDQQIEAKIEAEVRNIREKGKSLKKYLTLPEPFFLSSWFDYRERQVRRNIGVHNSWVGKNSYIQQMRNIFKCPPYRLTDSKMEEIKAEFKKIEDEIKDDFIGFNVCYFTDTYKMATGIIQRLEEHCLERGNNLEQNLDSET
jgi:hypothetical protein